MDDGFQGWHFLEERAHDVRSSTTSALMLTFGVVSKYLPDVFGVALGSQTFHQKDFTKASDEGPDVGAHVLLTLGTQWEPFSCSCRSMTLIEPPQGSV